MVSVLCPLIVRLCRNGCGRRRVQQLSRLLRRHLRRRAGAPVPIWTPCAILGAPTPGKSTAGPAGPPQQVPTAVDLRRSDTYYETKGAVFGALIEAIDLG